MGFTHDDMDVAIDKIATSYDTLFNIRWSLMGQGNDVYIRGDRWNGEQWENKEYIIPLKKVTG